MKHYLVTILLLLQLAFAASCKEEEPVVIDPLDFSISVSDIETASALVKVVPSHEEATYYFSVVPQSAFSEGSDFIAEVIAATPDIAGKLMLGEVSSKFADLQENTEYVAFAFELNRDLQPGTVLVSERFRTEKEVKEEEVKPDYANVDFTIQIKDLDQPEKLMEVKVNDDNVPYYFDIIDPEKYEMYDNFSEEGIQAYISSLFKSYGKKFNLSPEEVYAELVVKGNASRKYTKLHSGTEYYAYVVGMSKNDRTMTVPEIMVFRTPEPEQSDLTIDIEVLKEGPYSGKVKMTPSNPNHKYFFEFWEAENVDFYQLDDQGIIDMFEERRGEYIGILAEQGEQIYYREDLLPMTEYIVVAFGVEGSVANTGLFKTYFTTEGPMAPEEVTFDISVQHVSAVSADIRYEPWDPSHRFAYEVIEKSVYDAAADKKQFIQDYFNEILDAFMEENPVFSRKQCVEMLTSYWKSVDYKRDYLEPDTEYYAWAAVVDDDGNLLGEPNVEEFSTFSYEISDVKIEVSVGKYYSGTYLEESNPEVFEGLSGKAIFNFDIALTGDIAEYRIALLPGNLTDAESYGDFYLIGDINAFGAKNPRESDAFTCWMNMDVTLCAYALDEHGHYGKPFRKLINFKESGAIREEPPFLVPGIHPASLVK